MRLNLHRELWVRQCSDLRLQPYDAHAQGRTIGIVYFQGFKAPSPLLSIAHRRGGPSQRRSQPDRCRHRHWNMGSGRKPCDAVQHHTALIPRGRTSRIPLNTTPRPDHQLYRPLTFRSRIADKDISISSSRRLLDATCHCRGHREPMHASFHSILWRRLGDGSKCPAP